MCIRDRVGLGYDDYDREGRTLVADYGDFVFINAYFPNGSRDHSRVPFKMRYNADFLAYCNRLREAGRSVVFCGDVNTSHQEIDLARPRQNRNTTGFLPEERAWIDEVVAQGYVDTYRGRYPEQTGAYTWWAQVTFSREKNVGWRLDYIFVLSLIHIFGRLFDRVQKVAVAIDQAALACLPPGPHPAAADGIDRFRRQLTPTGHDGNEFVVGFVDGAQKDGSFLGRHRVCVAVEAGVFAPRQADSFHG